MYYLLVYYVYFDNKYNNYAFITVELKYDVDNNCT